MTYFYLQGRDCFLGTELKVTVSRVLCRCREETVTVLNWCRPRQIGGRMTMITMLVTMTVTRT